MTAISNHAMVLATRPNGEPRDDDFRLEQQDLGELQDGQILVRVLWLSLDPYMRPMMNDAKSYAKPVPIGGTVVGEVVGEVVESRSQKYSVGDHLTAYAGWQEAFIADDSMPGMYKIKPADVPLSTYLGVVGMPGRTAYGGLLYLGKPKSGETLVVSAASGAVGSVVGQMAKMMGCNVVGVAGGPDKCRYVTQQLGFDQCVDYKQGNLKENLANACPSGIDIYFENVGGDVARAVAPLLNKGSRVPICGFIANYNDTDISKAETPQQIFSSLEEPPEHRFFLQTEWQDEHQAITDQLTAWVKQGKLVYRESIAEGLSAAPAAFRGMLNGKNFGKQLVRIHPESKAD